MVEQLFYVDACIYLNFWQKEGDEKFGTPYWKSAKDFFEKHDNDNSIIYYSGFLLKELKFILSSQEFDQKHQLFIQSPNFEKIFISEREYGQARSIESELNYGISFFDVIHMLLAKKSDSILITRDKKLLDTAGKYSVIAKQLEELL
ncbi:MAG: PIN domain-containing protein [Nanoarchaeota archaeon]|nr:PIN domain-containing protein [Nanoarchaeota archaeon]